MAPIKELTKLRDVMLADIRIIPDFINPKSTRHKSVWDSLVCIIGTLSVLNQDKVLKEPALKNVMDDVEELVVEIIEEDVLLVQSSHYIIQLLDKYEALAVELELYEVAQNFNNFKKMYLCGDR